MLLGKTGNCFITEKIQNVMIKRKSDYFVSLFNRQVAYFLNFLITQYNPIINCFNLFLGWRIHDFPSMSCKIILSSSAPSSVPFELLAYVRMRHCSSSVCHCCHLRTRNCFIWLSSMARWRSFWQLFAMVRLFRTQIIISSWMLPWLLVFLHSFPTFWAEIQLSSKNYFILILYLCSQL